MKKISAIQAINSALRCHAETDLSLEDSFKAAFEMRSAINRLIDDGFSDELIARVLDDDERKKILHEINEKLN